jgi:hypothetical protein
MTNFTESISEQAAIDWLKELGYAYAFGPEVAFDDSAFSMASLRNGLPLSMASNKLRKSE